MASREVMPSMNSIYKSSGNGTVVSTKDCCTVNGYTWATNGYYEISPTGHTYEYNFIYDNTATSLLYIGFEKYDANKTPTSNNSCVYVLASSDGATNKRIKGTVNLATDSAGSPTKYIRLRILGNWNNNISNAVANIKLCSLREVSSTGSCNLNKNGIINADGFREGGLQNNHIHAEGICESYNIIEC